MPDNSEAREQLAKAAAYHHGRQAGLEEAAKVAEEYIDMGGYKLGEREVAARIAAARSDVPRLLAEIDRLRASSRRAGEPSPDGEKCATCDGSGNHLEYHGAPYPPEVLSCQDCRGTGRVAFPSQGGAPKAGIPEGDKCEHCRLWYDIFDKAASRMNALDMVGATSERAAEAAAVVVVFKALGVLLADLGVTNPNIGGTDKQSGPQAAFTTAVLHAMDAAAKRATLASQGGAASTPEGEPS